VLTAAACRVQPLLCRLGVTGQEHLDDVSGGGAVLAANHTALADPVLVLAALHRLGVRPVVLATHQLWRVPLLGRVLTAEGHLPVYRGTARASEVLGHAARALKEGRHVLIYPEGGLPVYRTAGDRPPGKLRSGVARLAVELGAPVLPLALVGARRVSSGSGGKQLAGWATAPLRRPHAHLHLGSALAPDGTAAEALAQIRAAMTSAWEVALAERR